MDSSAPLLERSRLYVIGDIHGRSDLLDTMVAEIERDLHENPTADGLTVTLGDYVDRGPQSREVVKYVRCFHEQTPARVVALRGNHEDAWLRVIEKGWDEFVLPPGASVDVVEEELARVAQEIGVDFHVSVVEDDLL